ncbi:hypothetical protein C0995_006961, partial [Termitomyces sp. Mi166
MLASWVAYLCLQPSDVDQLSDAEIVELLKDTLPLGTTTEQNSVPSIFGNTVYKLTTKTVVKPVQEPGANAVDSTEANALNLLFAETTILVPRVCRVVKHQDYFWIVMDYIPGSTLAQVWPTLSTWQKIIIAFTLRGYIHQLRRLKASATMPPGPLSRQGPQICESPIFGDVRPYRGPFASYTELSKFFNDRYAMAADIDNMPEDHPSRSEAFDNSQPLILTHRDLNLRNLILSKEGRLWIIDWAWAGYYPPYLEYATMLRQSADERVSGSNDKFWKKQQEPSESLPGTLPSTPSPLSSPPPKKKPKEESSPTASEAETSAALHLASLSSPSESSSDPKSSSSSDDLVPAHQNNSAIKPLSTYHLLRTTTNQEHHNMSSTLPFHVDMNKQHPLAEVKVTKLKDCPMLTGGYMDNNLFQQWSIACHQYKKHSRKKPEEIVAFVADGDKPQK